MWDGKCEAFGDESVTISLSCYDLASLVLRKGTGAKKMLVSFGCEAEGVRRSEMRV